MLKQDGYEVLPRGAFQAEGITSAQAPTGKTLVLEPKGNSVAGTKGKTQEYNLGFWLKRVGDHRMPLTDMGKTKGEALIVGTN